MALDAQSVKDGSLVCIKRITRVASDEVAIAEYLTSPELRRDSSNHCAPSLDSFQDPEDPGVRYMVMPILRPFEDPDFGARGEVVDFVTQILE
ncbi:hypothetical protein DXG03_005469, partial [Asterophora parasitica]